MRVKRSLSKITALFLAAAMILQLLPLDVSAQELEPVSEQETEDSELPVPASDTLDSGSEFMSVGIMPLTSDITNLVFDVSEYNILIEAGSGASMLKVTYTDMNGNATVKDQIPNTATIKVIGTADRDIDIVKVTGNITANICLENVEIKGPSYPAYPVSISEGAAVILKISGYNSLQGGDASAALAVLTNSSLRIQGTDTDELTCQGSHNAAGIGNASNSGNVGEISIEGGNITAIGGNFGAGIGGGTNNNSDYISISGGIVNSRGGSRAAGIGGGFRGAGGKIRISGGTIMATGSDLAAGVGNGHSNNAPGDIEITGGSVKAKSGRGTGSQAITDQAKNGASVPLYCNELTIGDPVPAGNTAITGMDVAGLGSYGVQDLKTDAAGKVYLWLPEDMNATAKVALKTTQELYDKSYSRPGSDIVETLLQRTLEADDTFIKLFDNYYEV